MSWGKGGGVELIEVFDAETAKKRRIRLTICTASNYAEQYEISGLRATSSSSAAPLGAARSLPRATATSRAKYPSQSGAAAAESPALSFSNQMVTEPSDEGLSTDEPRESKNSEVMNRVEYTDELIPLWRKTNIPG
jgi:hypothetical protein